jgi:hypothetical protein
VDVSISAPSAFVAAARMEAAIGVVDGVVHAAVLAGAQLLLTRIKANASGRPGPNAPTGDYRRSWTIADVQTGPGWAVASVGTNAPQGRRLEFGFHGVDSLGRKYNQPPYPHVTPAIAFVEPLFAAIMERIAKSL